MTAPRDHPLRTTGPGPGRAAFTLLELVVVIAIIALLLSILLPGLARARQAGMLAVSMSNLRQINTGGSAYAQSNAGRLPLFITYRRGSSPTPDSGPLEGFCTWSMAGKNNSSYWAGKRFDVEAADRPLNPYLGEEEWDAPAPPATLAKEASARERQARLFRDPSDIVSHQRTWPKPTPGISGYDDVGTSYHFNAKWWEQVQGSFARDDAGFVDAFEFGIRRIRLADTFNSSKFAWLHDQYADVIVTRPDRDFRLRNGLGDVNKSALAFLDGHAAYLEVIPGRGPESYSNDRYSFVFEDLRLPGH
ncbi:MAG: prepilin-type N-terminal cleavage/methylation domain-containing protein [Phycisphaerales bacterium]|nr:prepilin-type N-terminal cleavage/methylation domain-containing protein [Phycisphaerales bacterium]